MPLVESHNLAVTPFPKFTQSDFTAAAMACRGAAQQAEADAKKQENPSVGALFHRTAVGYRQLAAKFDQAAQAR